MGGFFVCESESLLHHFLVHLPQFSAIGKLIDTFGGLQANPALKAHADLYKSLHKIAVDELDEAQKRILELAAENDRLRSELDRAKKQIPNKDWAEYRGAKFKRRGIGFETDAYCPMCEIPMVSLEGELPFKCNKCKHMVNFDGHDLLGVLKTLQLMEKTNIG